MCVVCECVLYSYLHKLHWNGTSLHFLWVSTYSMVPDNTLNSGNVPLIRLGTGSGSTPSLLRDPADPSHVYIAITDDAEQMNVVVLDGHNGDVVARHPVTFGAPKRFAKRVVSEQSLVVLGDRILAVNNTPNLHRLYSLLQRLLPCRYLSVSSPQHDAFFFVFQSVLPILLQRLVPYIPVIFPDTQYGIEQFMFNFTSRQLSSVWFVQDVAIPNAIPSVSCRDGKAIYL